MAHEVKTGNREVFLEDAYRIAADGHYLYYAWIKKEFRLVKVEVIPSGNADDIFSQQEKNHAFFKENYNLSLKNKSVDKNGSSVNGGKVLSGVEDSLFYEAALLVVSDQNCSTSLIQRRFSIGYNRASRIVTALEENKIVGPSEGSKPREVLFDSVEQLNKFLNVTTAAQEGEANKIQEDTEE